MAALVNLADYEARAREVVAASTLDYYDGGANDEITLHENAAAFSRITLYPRVFRGTAQRDTSTRVLGFPVAIPILVAPVTFPERTSQHPDPPTTFLVRRPSRVTQGR